MATSLQLGNILHVPIIQAEKQLKYELDKLPKQIGQVKHIGKPIQLGKDEWTAVIKHIFFRFSPYLKEYSDLRIVSKQLNALWTAAANDNQTLKDFYAHNVVMFLFKSPEIPTQAATKALRVQEFLEISNPNQNPRQKVFEKYKEAESLQRFQLLRRDLSVKCPCCCPTLSPESFCGTLISIAAVVAILVYCLFNNSKEAQTGLAFALAAAGAFIGCFARAVPEGCEKNINEYIDDHTFNIELPELLPIAHEDEAIEMNEERIIVSDTEA